MVCAPGKEIIQEMNSSVHVFTSITSNYLPKARVLAKSVKKCNPEVVFHLLLSDDPPEGFSLQAEPFDSLITEEALAVENKQGWVFSHAVVELCTAVKGLGVEYIFDTFGADKVFYFDPDMAVFDRLDELAEELDSASVLLTPHQTEPETSPEAIMDNEMASLIFGVFNLGFLGVKNDENGRKFSGWWKTRLLDYCHDDRPRGLFTDQKWVNLAPCFFEGIRILRSPAYNVATWNITQRNVSGSFDEGFFVNGEPLGFYHFSGFDSGDQEKMLSKYGGKSPSLYELRNWYIRVCEEEGQSQLGRLPSKYAAYDDGVPVPLEHRLLYRKRRDLQEAFPDPFSTQEKGGYRAWYQHNGPQDTEMLEHCKIEPNALTVDVLSDFGLWFKTKSQTVATPWKRALTRALANSVILLVRIIR